MLSVEEALQQVLAPAKSLAAVSCPAREALGRVLAEDVASDVDSPPHDKSLVDGYALVAADLAGGSADFEVLEQIVAGAMPTREVAHGQAAQIMTGAPIPPGADCVVMVEQSQLLEDVGGPPRVRIVATPAAGQNIMRRASSMAQGQTVLRSGTRLRAVELGILAEVGRGQVRVVGQPTLAVLSTGNELVGSDQKPSAAQIRNSNAPMLVAAAQAAGAAAIDLGIARDEVQQLRAHVERGLEADVLVISGGVSAGVLDLVPRVLTELGVRQVFHKIKLKPGKPLWFGTRPRPGGQTLVFGLPGNPVSSLVCFELFVRPAIGRMAGRDDAALVEVLAELTTSYSQRGDRRTCHPARLDITAGRTTIEPLRWQGSGDLRTLVDANALAIFAPGERVYERGEVIRALRLKSE